jgi:hypothetical protein
MNRYCDYEGCRQLAHARGLCSTHYQHWRITGKPHWAALQEQDGLGVCECPTSYPDPKCCRRCGYPCVHRMAPRIRQLALTRQSHLARQVILPPPIQYEWSVSCR